MKRLILAINPYSALGKCAFTQVFEGMLSRKGIRSSTVTTVEENAASDAEIWDMTEELDTDQVLGFLDYGPVSIIDAPIGDSQQFIDFCHETSFVDALADEDAELTVVISVTEDGEAITRMVKLVEELADNAQYLVVHEADFEDSNWTNSYGEKVMSYLGAAEVEVPGIEEDILLNLAEAHEMSLSQALSERKMLPRILRDGIHRWEIDFAETLEDAVDILLPEDAEDKSVYVSGKKSAI